MFSETSLFNGHSNVMRIKSFEFGIAEEDGVSRQQRKQSVANVMKDMEYNWAPWSLMHHDGKPSNLNIPGKENQATLIYQVRKTKQP